MNSCLPLFAPCSIVKKYQLTSLVKLPLPHMFFKAKFELHISWWKKRITKCYKLYCFHRIHLNSIFFFVGWVIKRKSKKNSQRWRHPNNIFLVTRSQETKKEFISYRNGSTDLHLHWLVSIRYSFLLKAISQQTIVSLSMATTECNREFKKAQLSTLNFWVQLIN